MNESIQVENIKERKNWIAEVEIVRCWGNKISKAVVQVSPHSFNLLVSSREQPLGILEHMMAMVKGLELPTK